MKFKYLLQHRRILFIFFLFLISSFFVNIFIGNADNIKFAKDQLSTSIPSATTTHNILFTTTSDIPAMGSISVIPEEGKFLIPNDFDFSDMKFFVATSTEIATSTRYVTENIITTSTTTVGTTTVITTSSEAIRSEVIATSTRYIFVERQLSDVSTSTDDFVSINYGLSGLISIFLNSGRPVYSGSRIKLEIGGNNNGIINPSNIGSYDIDIKSYDEIGTLIGGIKTMISIVNPVVVNTHMPRMRSNGVPDGTLVGGTTQTIMSLITNFDASCKYSTASNTPYNLMEESFNTSDTFFHSVMLNDLVSGGFYVFYVRCDDVDEDYTDNTDFIISFNIETTGDGGTGGGEGGGTGDGDGDSDSGDDDGSGSGEDGGDGGGDGDGDGENDDGDEGENDSGDAVDDGGSGGGGGGGGGGGVGIIQPIIPKLENPDLSISGWSYSESEVIVLQDGVEIQRESSDLDGVFNISFEELEKGVYTYNVYSNDPEDVKSKGHSATFWMEDDTKTELSDIILPPTIQILSSSENIEILTVSGYSVPGSQIEAWYYPKNTTGQIIKEWVQIDQNFKWSLDIDKTELEYQNYLIKTRSNLPKVGYSGFSDIKEFSINQNDAEEGECKISNADLNNDDSVNLVDFSILMYHWGTSNVAADVNCDGNVNLVDFSILMYNWTG